MRTLRHLFTGLGALFAITTPPLYRYPYRNNMEGFRGDWQKIGKDIEAALYKDDDDYE